MLLDFCSHQNQLHPWKSKLVLKLDRQKSSFYYVIVNNLTKIFTKKPASYWFWQATLSDIKREYKENPELEKDVEKSRTINETFVIFSKELINI